MSLTPLAELFYQEFRKIHRSDADTNHKIIELQQLLVRLLFELTKSENIPFTTLFARTAFACHKYNVSAGAQWRIVQLHKRKSRALSATKLLPEIDYLVSLKTACFAVAAFTQLPVPEDLRAVFPSEELDETPRTRLRLTEEKRAVMHVMILDCNPAQEWLLCQWDEASDDELIRVKYAVSTMNESYNKTIELLRDDFQYKASANLLDVSISEDGIYYPKAIVLEPDFLVDVSLIAECFQGDGAFPQQSILRRFLPKESSVPLAIGNIANYFLDELMTDIQADFTQVFGKVFSRDPMAFTLFSDDDVRKIYQESKSHFVHLQQVIRNNFPERGVDARRCVLEPSFYSQRYGIQGRLDIWQPQDSQHEATIVELKSGKPFRPNKFGIGHNHYVQTLLYDLLVGSVFDLDKKNAQSFILYSALDSDALRYAPVTKEVQDEAMQLRNELIATEHRLAALDTRPYEDYCFLDKITPEHSPKVGGFTLTYLTEFAKALQGARALERAYFLSMVSFLAREHRLTRTGVEGNDRANGQASLWINKLQEKRDAFEILDNLTVLENHAAEDRPSVVFERSDADELANFRVGDIVVVYPFEDAEDTVLDSQIFKGSIEEITSQQVRVGFRYKQFNDDLFESGKRWRLEPDTMDTSFTSQYQSLYAFLQAPIEKRDLLLTLVAPRHNPNPEAIQLHAPRPLSAEQTRIIQKVLASPDYFLLVGPPGTGKTKFMLAELVRYLLEQTNENILLMAYTNRAVDEICDAIEEFAEGNYLRLGSRNGSEERFHERLLSVQAERLSKRQELRDLIQRHRIFVATVAAVANNAQLFKIKQFNTAIIDEASQILEPMLAGILPRFQRFVLIGDHKQLPAVVQQPKERSEEKDESLRAIGLTDRRNSLFERLYQRAQQENWHWAIDMLQHQGRMHGDIMQFPSRFFYNNRLLMLPKESSDGQWQRAPLSYQLPEHPTELERRLTRNRMLYIPSRVETSSSNRKINNDEAQKVAETIQALLRVYQANGKTLLPKDIGVITPFRAQIAKIRQAIETLCGADIAQCTIDTVERYQGGARDVIIISLCMNTLYQMENIVSLSEDEQVDRKLNVALTRARQHLVVIGNENLMRSDRRYAQLIDFIEDMNFKNR